MSSFDLLSPQMQKKIWDMRWDQFTPIQDKAIPALIETENDIIISSGTASGKTEAAFLPILSIVEKTALENIKVLYISPLKALINNQFDRIEKLCDGIGIQIHKWHGDVAQNKKRKIIKKPNGILQITPESIESLFINRTSEVSHMLKHLDFIIIDEIHSFMDNARGIHLRSLLSRVEGLVIKRPRFIGLSATISSFDFIKEWINPMKKDTVQIIHEKGGGKELLYHLMHFQNEKGKINLELFEDIRGLTRDSKAIIFANKREEVEMTTLLLNRLSEKEGAGQVYFPHHSSLDKTEREYVEKLISESTLPKSVIATSSLELGIDIGSIDIVIQLDCTFSVSSLRQRLGRSGRKQDETHVLQLYSTDKISLLQSVAVMELSLGDWVEPSMGYREPLDVLFHQIISFCQQFNGIHKEKLIHEIRSNHAFYRLVKQEIETLIDDMLQKEILEELPITQEVIVGLEGERILRGKEFYSVFMTQEMYQVFSGIKLLGEIDKLNNFSEGDKVILGGKLWEIWNIDSRKNKLYVKPAPHGKPTKYYGNVGNIHEKVGERMMEIRCSEQSFEYIDDNADYYLNDYRIPYLQNHVTAQERIIWKHGENLLFETYASTVIWNTLKLMFKHKEIKLLQPYHLSIPMIYPPNLNFLDILEEIKNAEWNPLTILEGRNERFISKYSSFLPDSLNIKMYTENIIDIKATLSYLKCYRFRVIETIH